MDIITIILIIIIGIIAFLIGKYITEQKKWGTKKAELEKKFEEIKSELEKKVLENEKENEKKIAELKEKFLELIKGHRRDAIMKSRNTIMGKLWETITPYIPKFIHNPADMRFLGSPIDYIIFDGMKEKDIRKVIFLEVKSGNSKLNAQEKKLKEVIQNKKVKWEEFRLDDITTKKPDIDDKIIEKELKEELEELDKPVSDEIKELLCEECGRRINHRGKCFPCNVKAKREREKK